MVLNLPCSVYGEVPVTFLVEAENNDLQTSITHALFVNQDYGYELEVDELEMNDQSSVTKRAQNFLFTLLPGTLYGREAYKKAWGRYRKPGYRLPD